MALSIKKNSEIVLQILYSFELGVLLEEEIVPFLMQELKLTKKDIQESYNQALTIWEKRQEFDEMIGKVSTAYDFKRIGVVEKSILRLTLFQKKEGNDSFSIALQLAKKFSGDSAASFIHALLETLHETPLSPCK